MNILIAEPNDFSPQAVQQLREVGNVDLTPLTQADLPRALNTYDLIWVRLHLKLTSELLLGAEQTRYLVTATTGLDHIDLAAAEQQHIQVVSLKGHTDFLAQIHATAELSLGLLLALLRRIPAAAADVCHGAWNRDAFRGRDVHGRQAAIIGYGRLGRAMAGYLQALGVSEVRFYDPAVSEDDGACKACGSVTEAVQDADIISIHVTYDETTHHLINEQVFAACKPSAVLVNTSRGGVLDEAALLDALRRDRLAGAAVDVLQGEPDIGAEHPMVAYAREHDHLIITPHIGGASKDVMQRCEDYLADYLIDEVL